MKDYFGNQVEVGDIILLSNLSKLEEHVVLSINSKQTAMSVSCKRYRFTRSWSSRRFKPISWEVDRVNTISVHNSKKSIWVISDRIIKIGKFGGDLKQFKTNRQLENEYNTQNI